MQKTLKKVNDMDNSTILVIILLGGVSVCIYAIAKKQKENNIPGEIEPVIQPIEPGIQPVIQPTTIIATNYIMALENIERIQLLPIAIDDLQLECSTSCIYWYGDKQIAQYLVINNPQLLDGYYAFIGVGNFKEVGGWTNVVYEQLNGGFTRHLYVIRNV